MQFELLENTGSIKCQIGIAGLSAFSDNRCCTHRAMWNYWPAERWGRRVAIKGDGPS